MQKFFLLFLSITLSIFNCKYPAEQKLSPVAKLIMAQMEQDALNAYLQDTTRFAWGSFKDNNNGTVTFTGDGNYTGQTITFLKCSQGQTYNSTTNGCDGTATTHRFCSTDTNDCSNNDASKVLGEAFLNGATSEAYTSCNSVGTFAEKTGWRVPTKAELKVIILCGDKNMPADNSLCSSYTAPTVNTTLFPSTVAGYYWTSSSNTDNNHSSWHIYFGYGFPGYASKLNPYYVRCVTTN
jgi:hypothetical protein